MIITIKTPITITISEIRHLQFSGAILNADRLYVPPELGRADNNKTMAGLIDKGIVSVGSIIIGLLIMEKCSMST